MDYLGEYTEVGWQNEPSRATPINAHNLGIMEDGIKRLFYYLLAGGGTGGGSAADGREVELRNNGEYIQWKYSGEEEWINLVLLSDLKGEKGDDYVLTEEDMLKIAEKVKIDAPDSAADISFKNEGTNIESTDVQGAISELSGQKIDHPSTGQVGQILEIETVDENGKPKTYKAADKPQGGGTGGDYTLPVASSVTLGGVKPVTKTGDMTQEVGVDGNGKLYTAPTSGESDTETDSDFAGYSGILYYAGGTIRAYNPIVNTVVDDFKSAKVSAYLQHYAKDAQVYSTPGVLAHESAFSKKDSCIYSWVENITGTSADIPDMSETGCTAVKARRIKGGNFISQGVPLPNGDTIFTVAQKGDEAVNTLTGETFNIQGGVGYQTYRDNYILCGYLKGYQKLRGMTIECRYGSVDGKWQDYIGTRQTWTLTINGELGDYDYNRFDTPLKNADLHPSNQVAKIGSTYYRADIVPNNGFILVSSPDLVNWTFVSHVTLPKGFDDRGQYEVCLGGKREIIYFAMRQINASGALYVGKLTPDFTSVDTVVSLPDCGSKPYFMTFEINHLFLVTAPVDRYGCKVYDIVSDYQMNKIIPLFEIHGTSCNYPVIGEHASGSGYFSFAGTNGAQTDKKGVSVLPVLINFKTLIKRVPAPTDVLLVDSNGNEILYGEWNDIPSFGSTSDGSYIKPVEKTEEMTQSVGVDENGELWTKPNSGASGAMSWENVANETLEAEATGFTEIVFETPKYINRIKAYIKTVGTATNDGDAYLELLINGKKVGATQNCVSKTDGETKHAFIDIDLTASGTFSKGYVQTSNGDTWSSQTNNVFKTEIKSNTEVNKILVRPYNGWKKLGVGSQLVLDIC